MSDDVSCPALTRTLHLDFQNLADSQSSCDRSQQIHPFCAGTLSIHHHLSPGHNMLGMLADHLVGWCRPHWWFYLESRRPCSLCKILRDVKVIISPIDFFLGFFTHTKASSSLISEKIKYASKVGLGKRLIYSMVPSSLYKIKIQLGTKKKSPVACHRPPSCCLH